MHAEQLVVDAWARLLRDPTDQRARTVLARGTADESLIALELVRQGYDPTGVPDAASWWPVASSVPAAVSGPVRVGLDGHSARDRDLSFVCGPREEVFLAVPSPKGSVVLWDARTARYRHLLIALGSDHPSVVASGRSGSATRIATSHPDDRFRLWDPVTGEEIRTTDVGPAEAVAFASNSDQLRVISASAHRQSLWDGTTGELLGQVEMDDARPVRDVAVALGPDGTAVVAVETQRLVDGWFSGEIEWGEWRQRDVHRVAGTGPMFVRRNGGRPALAFRHYEHEMVAGGRRYVSSELHLRDASTGGPVTTPIPHDGGIGAVRSVDRGAQDVVATADDAGTLRLLEPSSGEVLALAETRDVLVTLGVTPDGGVVAAGLNATLHLWDGGSDPETIDLGLEHQLESIDITSVDGSTVVVTDDPLCLWNLTGSVSGPGPAAVDPIEPEARSLLGELDGRTVEAVLQERPGRPAVIRCVDVTDRSVVGRTIHGMPPAHQVGFARTLDERSILVALTSATLFAFDRLVPPDKGPVRAGEMPNVSGATVFVALDPVHPDTVRVALRSDAGVDVVDVRIGDGRRPEEDMPPVYAGPPQPPPDARLPERWLIGAPEGWLRQEGVPGFSTGPARFAVTFLPAGPLRRASSGYRSIQELEDGHYGVRGHLSQGRLQCGIELVADEQASTESPHPPDGLMVEGRVSLHIGYEHLISSAPRHPWVIEEIRPDGVLVCRLDQS